MADLQKGRTFAPGDTVTHTDLNNLVDLGIVLAAFISAKPSTTPAAGDYYVIWDATTSALAKIPFIGNVTSVGLIPPAPFTVSGSPVTGAGDITLALPSQSGNVFFCSPVLGVSGAPLFRHIVAQDTVNAATGIAAFAIDWRINTNFFKTIVGNSTFTWSGAIEGQHINVMVATTGAFTVTWPAGIKWRGGVAPVMTAIAGRTDIFHFYFQGGVYFGWADQNFF